MRLIGPVEDIAEEAERVLRTLPRWFGIESSLLEYAQETKRFPTFAAEEKGEIIAFLTLKENFPGAWEVHCLAVQSAARSSGVGRLLHRHVESWLLGRGAFFLQVKTVGSAHPSVEYAETRAFYRAVGYRELEVFPELWGPGLPVLQLVKALQNAA